MTRNKAIALELTSGNRPVTIGRCVEWLLGGGWVSPLCRLIHPPVGAELLRARARAAVGRSLPPIPSHTCTTWSTGTSSVICMTQWTGVSGLAQSTRGHGQPLPTSARLAVIWFHVRHFSLAEARGAGVPWHACSHALRSRSPLMGDSSLPRTRSSARHAPRRIGSTRRPFFLNVPLLLAAASLRRRQHGI